MFVTFTDPSTNYIFVGESQGIIPCDSQELFSHYLYNENPMIKYCIDFYHLIEQEQTNIYIVNSFDYSTSNNFLIYVDEIFIVEDERLSIDHLFYFDNLELIEPNLEIEFDIYSPLTFDNKIKESVTKYPLFKVQGFIRDQYIIDSNKEDYFDLCDKISKDYPLVNIFPYNYLQNIDICNKDYNDENNEYESTEEKFILIEGSIEINDFSNINNFDNNLLTYFLIPFSFSKSLTYCENKSTELENTLSIENKDISVLLRSYIASRIIKPQQLIKRKINKKIFSISTSDDISQLFNPIKLVTEELIYNSFENESYIDNSEIDYDIETNKFMGFFNSVFLLSNDIYDRLFLFSLANTTYNDSFHYIDFTQIERVIYRQIEDPDLESASCFLSRLHLPKITYSGVKLRSKYNVFVWTPADQLKEDRTYDITIDTSVEQTNKNQISKKLTKSGIKITDSILSINSFATRTIKNKTII